MTDNIIISSPVVGAIIINNERQVLAGTKKRKLQLIQGSVDHSDLSNYQNAIFREIHEESGLLENQLMLLAPAPDLISYTSGRSTRIPGITHRTVLWYLFCIKDKTAHITPDKREFDGGMGWYSWLEFIERCADHKKDMYSWLGNVFHYHLIE